MSVYPSRAVWQDTGSKGGALTVLLALADIADEHGVAWPGYQRLSQMTRLSQRQVKANVQALERMGELDVYERAGPYRCNVYVIKFCKDWRRSRQIIGVLKAGRAPRRRFPDEADEDLSQIRPGGENAGTKTIPRKETNSPPKQDAEGILASSDLTKHQHSSPRVRNDTAPPSPSTALGPARQIWQIICSRWSNTTWTSWFEGVEVRVGDDITLIFGSQFRADYCQQHYGLALQEGLGKEVRFRHSATSSRKERRKETHSVPENLKERPRSEPPRLP